MSVGVMEVFSRDLGLALEGDGFGGELLLLGVQVLVAEYKAVLGLG